MDHATVNSIGLAIVMAGGTWWMISVRSVIKRVATSIESSVTKLASISARQAGFAEDIVHIVDDLKTARTQRESLFEILQRLEAIDAKLSFGLPDRDAGGK